ncbi:MAG: hypothetical protein JXR22_00945, partial [Prolixibacteraceae bacterium]|nr:hypothetical protein [Prolixibacteraceae bacterium]
MKLLYAGLVLFLFLLNSRDGRATDNPANIESHKIGLNTGLYNFGSIDELYSFARYSGRGMSYGLKFWNGQTNKNHLLSLRFAMIERHPNGLQLDPKYFALTDPNLVKNSFMFEAIDHYRYLIKSVSNQYIKLYGEGVWVTSVNITTNANSLPELIQSGIGAGLYATAAYKKHLFSGEMHVPLLTWTVRNNYSMSMTQNYEKLSKWAFIRQNDQLQFPNTLLALNTSLEYEYAILKQLSISGEYQLRFML